MNLLNNNRILVSILTYKNPSLLETSIKSLITSRDKHLYDIIVIDNNNGKDETSLICSRFLKEEGILEYISRKINSITDGYNDGINYAISNGYKYISFWCDDWAYTDGAFPEMLNGFQKDNAGCITALSNYCSTSEHFIEGNLLSYLRGLDRTVKPSLLTNAIKVVSKNIYNTNVGKYTESEFFCIGFLCDVEMVKGVGPFNKDIVSMNDVEYSIRAFKQGWKSYVSLGSYIHHIGMHAAWGQRPAKEHRDAETNDRKIFKTSVLYSPDEKLTSHTFWDRKLKYFYE